MTLLRSLRESAGLTQSELARKASVSRQLITATEAGTNLPRVDAALAIAAALGVDVADLFRTETFVEDIIDGSRPHPNTLVRSSRVGDRLVTSRCGLTESGWDTADGIIDEGGYRSLTNSVPGVVVVGCEPGIEVIEGVLREGGMAAVSALASSAVAIAALAAGRAHAAVVHGRRRRTPPKGLNVDRYQLVSWQVGLAVAPDAPPDTIQTALSGTAPVIQREDGAGVQRAFEQALPTSVSCVPGPRVSTHLDSARRAVTSAMAGVTIEPAARAVGAVFHPIEVHRAELWVERTWRTDPAVSAAMDVVASDRFQQRLRSVGGYDLSDCGKALE